MSDSEFDQIVPEETSPQDGDRSRVARKLASGCSVPRSGPLAAHALEQATTHLRIARRARQLDLDELRQIAQAFDEFSAELERARSSAVGAVAHDQDGVDAPE